MCRIAVDAELLRRGGSELSKLCNGCRHAVVCGWQRQLGCEAQVWIGSNNLLFHPRSSPIPPVDFVVVDESPINSGFRGFSRSDNMTPYYHTDLLQEEVNDFTEVERLMLPLSEDGKTVNMILCLVYPRPQRLDKNLF
jgi:hypothetical protein